MKEIYIYISFIYIYIHQIYTLGIHLTAFAVWAHSRGRATRRSFVCCAPPQLERALEDVGRRREAEGDRWFGAMLAYLGLRGSLVAAAVLLTKRCAPAAAGSGIPEMKSTLAGFSIDRFLDTRTLIVKVGGGVRNDAWHVRGSPRRLTTEM